MENGNLIEALQSIKVIADTALAGKTGKQTKKVPKLQPIEAPNSLPEHLVRLRDEGFFRQPKTYNEAHEKLGSTYPCEPKRVHVALIRLQQGKHMRKASKLVNGRKQNAYVW